MNQQPKPREVVFDCLVCFNPSYQPKPEIDFGTWGKYGIPVCGGCMCSGDESKITSITQNTLISFVPPKLVEARMREVLAEYHEALQQGS